MIDKDDLILPSIVEPIDPLTRSQLITAHQTLSASCFQLRDKIAKASAERLHIFDWLAAVYFEQGLIHLEQARHHQTVQRREGG